MDRTGSIWALNLFSLAAFVSSELFWSFFNNEYMYWLLLYLSILCLSVSLYMIACREDKELKYRLVVGLFVFISFQAFISQLVPYSVDAYKDWLYSLVLAPKLYQLINLKKC